MKRILSTTLIALMVLLPSAMQAKVNHLLPKPHSVTVSGGEAFALGRAVTITDETGCVALQKFFTENDCTIGEGGAAVTVTIVESIADAYDYTLAGFDNEAYTLTVTADAINITAVTETGVIRAAQTLTQLAEGYDGTPAVEAVEIKDWAAFKLRGFMHDVGRSFIEVETIKKHIDLLSRFKVNCFHWHFTENQAWRFEVEAYPALTSTESMTRFAGKYYTQEECKEVAAYAKERGVIIIPEIDMPGHSEAFVRAMGFDMQTDEGVEVLKNVLTEVASVFPDAPYIHIGADEKKITYTNFLGIMTDHIHGLGKKVVVWNPISGVNVSNTDTDMTQMWSSAGNKITGRPNIDCRYNYTNHFDIFADVVGIYRSNIYYVEQGNSEVAGTISAYWNDRKTPTEEDIVKQNNMYANVIASAERAWIGGGKQYIEAGGTMLPNSGEEFDEFADWERRFLFHKENSLAGEPIPYVKQTNVRWRITDAFPNGGNAATIFPPEEAGKSTSTDLLDESYTYNGTTYYTGMATGAGIYLRHTWGNNTIPTYYGKTNHSNATAYAWTYVYSPTQQTVGAQIEFQNYGRSEKDKAPNAGNWDHKGSDIWINGVRIDPPTWGNSGATINNEVDLLNENFTAREPIAVTLNAGWNKVFIKLPYIGLNAGVVRLNKWMFTCVFTDTEGKNAVEGLIYSPNQCMDDATEQVAAKISEMKRDRGAYIGTTVGMWPESAATTIDSKIEEIEATYSTAMSEEERAEQITELETAWTAFTASLAAGSMNQPVASTQESSTYYLMNTPLRGSRYPTGKGTDAEIIGETTTTAASYWKFVKRTDGKFDIINYADDTFISPASNNNTALRTVTTQPSAGWEIKPADAPGYVIIVSGSAQFNQTNNSTQGFKVYNWGSGTNTTDTGCKYKMLAVAEGDLPAKPEEIEAPTPFAAVVGIEDSTYPYKLTEAQESAIFAKENLTIAFDLTTSNSTSANEAFIAASDPTAAGQETNVATSTFTSVGTYGAQIRFYISAKSGQWHSRGSGVTASTRHKIVLVFTNGANSKCYVNGTAYDSGLAQDFYHLASNTNANIYIGGGVTSGGNVYPFKGQIHSVQFFDKAMTADEIATIDYDVEIPGKKLTVIANATLADATFGWNGETLTSGTSLNIEDGTTINDGTLTLTSHSAAYKFEGFYSDASYTTALGTSYEIEEITENTTIYAKFSLDIFSESVENGIPVQIYNFRAPNFDIRLNAADSYNGNTINSGQSAYGEGEIWYFVGTESSFKLYSRVAGNSLAVKLASTNRDAAATMAEASEATALCLTQQSNGSYAISPVGTTGQSFNMHGGNGNDIKLYNTSDGGSTWCFNKLCTEPLNVNYITNFDGGYENNTRIGNLAININGTTSNINLTKESLLSSQSLYLPVGATCSMSAGTVYRGWSIDFNGEASIPEQVVPETGGEISVTIAVDKDNKYQYLYYSNDSKGKPYRIPAIATAPNGTIFAISDNRPCGSDIGYGEVDIKCRISNDNGETWGEEFFIADGQGGNTNVMTTGFGDAAIVADREQNKLLVMMVCGRTVCWNGRWHPDSTTTSSNINRVARVYATYNEENSEWEWTEPVEVTNTIYPLFLKDGVPTVSSMFIGSGRICQSSKVKVGDYYRIYCSMWTRDNGNRVIYSDDFGGSWNILGTVDDRPAPGGDEPKIEELADGSIVLSSRKSYGRYFNIFTFTDIESAAGSWGTVASSNNVSNGLSFGNNSTNGEIMRIKAVRKSDNTVCDVMLQSVPCGDGRRDVGIFYKEMGYGTNGENIYTPTTFSQGWTKGLAVTDKESAYSTMTLQSDGRIGFFYEEVPNGYCMVYVPLTLEEITGGKYSVYIDPTTGIEGITTEAGSNGGNAIYDLSGRKIKSITQSGIYIIGDKKVVIEKN